MSKGGAVSRVPVISGSDYPDELHLLLKNEVMIRRLKVNVVNQLPPLRLDHQGSVPRHVFLTPSSMKPYRRYVTL